MSPEKETKENNAQASSAGVSAPADASDEAKVPSSGQNQPSQPAENENSSKGEPDSDDSGEHEPEEEEDDLNLSNDDLPPVDPPSGKMLLFGNLLSAALLYAFLWDRLITGIHQNDSVFRAIPKLIPTPFYAAAFAVPAILGVCALIRAIKGFDRRDRIYRLPPIAIIIFLSIYICFIRAFEPLRPSANFIITDLILTSINSPFTSEDGRFPVSPKFYADAFEKIPPPFWKNGDKLTRWNAIVTENCAKPAETLPPMVEPGTLLICVSPERDNAWIQAVGLDRDDVGIPALLSFKGKTITIPLKIQKQRQEDNSSSDGLFRFSPPNDAPEASSSSAEEKQDQNPAENPAQNSEAAAPQNDAADETAAAPSPSSDAPQTDPGQMASDSASPGESPAELKTQN